MNHLAVVIQAADNVATAVADLSAGAAVSFFVGQDARECELQEDIPIGHKFAILDIPAGEAVIKYGEAIGTAAVAIPRGARVHIHNMESRRGRGDRS
ncbi:MAG: UxaA family hydrolase [Gracilibacteraceae bacterium]|jgi:altronate dehydratase small subunit|nr:UxaA family hydrolase [Gracilibacteraceae bacterium]